MLDLHLGYLEELNSIAKENPFAGLFVGRDSNDGQEDTSIVAPGTGGGGANIFPFQLVASGDSQTLYVRYGTVNSNVPTISATALVADYTSNVLGFTATGTTNFYLNCVVSVTNGISSVDSVSIGTSAVSESTTATSQEIGVVIADSGVLTTITNSIQGSQNVDSCGSLHSWNLV